MGVPSIGSGLVVAVVLVTLSASRSVAGEADKCGFVYPSPLSTKAHKAICQNDQCCNNEGRCGTSENDCNPDKGCDKNYGRCNGGCFPGDSMVRTRGNKRKPISELHTGEEVAIWNSKGQVEYEPVYAHGHRDADALAVFVSITLKPQFVTNTSRLLQLTSDHFIVVVTGNNQHNYKRAKDVRIGDKMIAMDDELHASTFFVSDVQEQLMFGLYNPITTSGTIMVNDVVASCYSHWFLDAFFDKLGVPHLIPSAYQVMLAPARLLYNLMGKKAYISVYDRMRPHVDIANSMQDLKGYLGLLLMSLEDLHKPTK